MTKTSWTPERVAELRRLAGLGFSTLKIARMMNTTVGSVSAVCSIHGIKRKGRGDGKRREVTNRAPVTLPGPKWANPK